MKSTKLLQFNFSRNSVYPLWIVRSFHYILVFGIFFTNCNLPGIFRFPTELFYFLRNTSDYRISGEILNLRGSELKIVVSVNQSSGITRTEELNLMSGSQNFSTNSLYPNQSIYSVEILNQATNPVQFCSLSNANGSINNAEVNSILISCVDADTSVSQPVFSLPSGEYPLAQNITITTSTLGASLYYTLNGSNPSCSPATGTLYTGAILIPQPSLPSVNLRAVACKGNLSSPVASVTYAITNGLLNAPTLSLAPGSYGSSQSITITAPVAPPGVVLHYTTNGVNPVGSI
ncbi:MAG: chitobiase/beta-hexosaminidase C-terminal domain-containing protein [Leptospiraceae bacterium]|nr:chitobiase/beta-hexosaminidase C-terminal domain-containing protein [Leptospiraceae bacterium]